MFTITDPNWDYIEKTNSNIREEQDSMGIFNENKTTDPILKKFRDPDFRALYITMRNGIRYVLERTFDGGFWDWTNMSKYTEEETRNIVRAIENDTDNVYGIKLEYFIPAA